MATVFFNKEIEGKGKVWTAKNGATRRALVLVINQEDFPNGIDIDSKKGIKARVGYLDKGNHSFIFINKNKKNDNNILGVFLNGNYGYECLNDKEIYANNSVGGYGNSESRFGIYKLGAVIEKFTYKDRTPSTFSILTKNGWKDCGTEAELYSSTDDDCKAVLNCLNNQITEID